MKLFDRESSVTHTPSVEEVDHDGSVTNVVFAKEMDPLEQVLNLCIDHFDCRVESACDALDPHLWRSEIPVVEDCIDQTTPFNQPSLDMKKSTHFLMIFSC